MIDSHDVHADEGYMTDNYTDVELLSKLESGVHVRYNGLDGEHHTGMVLNGPRCFATAKATGPCPSQSEDTRPQPSRNGPTVRIRCDHRRKTTTVSWTNVMGVEADEGE